jgi:UDP-N-acetylglucosamine--N-acetylmuramyl-(pentapeptide) pyrophosphoryl-undecaprenol N-acetylglucosamine transferase
MRRDRPAVVVGFGGYPSDPALIAAAWLTIAPRDPRTERRAGPGEPAFAPRVDRVACGVWPTEPAAWGVPVMHTGNPVRAAILSRGRRALHPARRLADEPSGVRRQPGRAAPVRPWCPAAVALLPEAICGPAAARGAAGPARGYRTGRPTAYAAASTWRAEVEPVLRRHAPPPDRGAAGHRALRRVLVADICVVGRPRSTCPMPPRARRADRQCARRSRRCRGRRLGDARSKLTPEDPVRHIAAILKRARSRAMRMSQAALALGRARCDRRLVALVDLAETWPKDAA